VARRKVREERVALLIDDLTADWTGVSARLAWQPDWTGPRLQIISTVAMNVPGETAWHRGQGRSILDARPLLGVRVGPCPAEPVRPQPSATADVRRTNPTGVTLAATSAFTSDSDAVLNAMADALADVIADLMAIEYVNSTGESK
jgi:hypothetical protein